MENQLVPALRFPGFDEEWEIKKIKDIAPLQRGFDLPSTELIFGSYPVVYSNGIRNYHISYKVSGPGIVTGRSGTIGKLHFLQGNFWPHNTSLWVTDFKNNEPKFIYYFFSVLDFSKFNAGSTVPTLNRNDVHGLHRPIPSLPEQQKIADYLSLIDAKINLLEEKKAELSRYKKAMMQKLFSQQIRFRDEDGKDFPDWEEKRLGDNAVFFSGGTPTSTKVDYYNGDIPFIKSGEIFSITTKQFITEKGFKDSSAKMVKEGDLLYALYGATSGYCSLSQINGAINQAILCIRSKFINLIYLQLLLTYNKDSITERFLQGGQGNLSAALIKGLIFNFPSLPEQQKIADFLSTIDESINKVDEQIKQTKAFKKAMLQQMFV